MSRNELVAKIEALNEWENLIEEAKAEAEAIRDSIKAEMLERDTVCFQMLRQTPKLCRLAGAVSTFDYD